VKFGTYTLIDNSPDRSGEQLTTYERFQHVVRQAQWAEELGFDAYGVGERHAQRFISSSPPVILAYIAAATTRIRLLTTSTGSGTGTGRSTNCSAGYCARQAFPGPAPTGLSWWLRRRRAEKWSVRRLGTGMLLWLEEGPVRSVHLDFTSGRRTV
jgi:hypothetical protein